MHHSPATERCVAEAWRVLRPGGMARIMVYHTRSLVGLMLWARYGLLAGRPGRKLADIYFHHLESPGTKVYTLDEARALARRFSDVRICTYLASADLLDHQFSSKYQGAWWRWAKRLYPRWLVRHVLGDRFGTYLTIEATKR